MLVDVTDLKPDILFGQWSGWYSDNVSKTLELVSDLWNGIHTRKAYLKTLLIFLLLFIDYAEAKVDFISLLKVGLHAHHLGESFFRVFKRSISIIEDTNSIP